MLKLDAFREGHKQGLHAGAAKSLRVTISLLKGYLATGNLSHAVSGKGLRKQHNELLDRALQFAAQRGAHQERQQIVSVLNATWQPTSIMPGCNAERDETVVPICFKRAG